MRNRNLKDTQKEDQTETEINKMKKSLAGQRETAGSAI
jgi:hypothetical protein